jgi:RimJ/RimL family protein N-acetyltransferase
MQLRRERLDTACRRHPVTIAQSDSIVFRRMTEADLDYVMSIECAAAQQRFVWEWSRKQHEQSLKSPARLHLIVESVPLGKSVGFILINDVNSPSKCVEFQRIVIQPTNQGYGSQAIRLLKRYVFEDLKAHRLWLSVKEFNARARAVYRSEGFIEEGTLRECVKGPEQYESVIIMAILDREYKPA